MPQQTIEVVRNDPSRLTASADHSGGPHVPYGWLESIRTFWVTATALFVILMTLIPLVNNGFIALPDEGVYSAQASALSNGSWEQPRPAPDVDIKGYFDPVGPSAIKGDRRIPYGRHPLYGLTLSVFYRVAGQSGMLFLSTATGLCIAILTGLIARRIRATYGVPALLLTAIGSPILFNSFIVSAHNIATMLAGALALCGLAFSERPKWWAATLMAPAAFLLPCFRSEGSIFVASVAIAFGVSSIGWPIRKRPHFPTLLAGVIIGLFGVSGFLVDLRASRAVLSLNNYYSNPIDTIGGAQSGPLNAAWIALAQPWSYGGDAILPLLLTVSAVLVAALSLRAFPRFQLLPLTLIGISAASAVWIHFTRLTPITGLIATMPTLLFSAFWLRCRDLKDRNVAILSLTSTISLILLLATIYGDGGAAQWGGRLIQILLPVAIPLAVIGMDNARKIVSRESGIFAGTCLAILAVALGTFSLRTNSSLRETNGSLVAGTTDAVTQFSHGKTVTLLARGHMDGSPRSFWNDDVQLNLLSTSFRNSYLAVQLAEKAGYDTVIFITDAPDDALKKADLEWAETLQMRRSSPSNSLSQPQTIDRYRVFVFSKPKG